MPSPREPGEGFRALILCAVLFVSYAYFYQAGGWNQNSRFALVRAVVERGTLAIDPYSEHTGDIAERGGHFYSDKAPGLAFAAVPVVAAARPVVRALGVDPLSFQGIAVLSALATILTSGLWTAVAAGLLWRIARTLGASEAGGAVAALVYGLGTPMWAYATLFWGHALATALVVVQCWAVLLIGTSVASPILVGALIGFAGGFATLSEYDAVVAAALFAAWGAWRAAHQDAGYFGRMTASLVLSAGTCAAALAAYDWSVSGSPWTLSYAMEVGFPGLHRGIFGFAMPRPGTGVSLLFGEYRGLLPLAPVLAAAPVGWWCLLRDRRTRLAGLAALLLPLFYLLLNAGGVYWDAGWTYGPRYMSAGLPFWCLGVAIAWTKLPRLARPVLTAMALVGVALAGMAVATSPQPPGTVARPVRQFIWPAFDRGYIALNPINFTEKRSLSSDELLPPREQRAAWNLGQKWFHLKGRRSLLPLLAAWFVAFGAWTATQRRRPATAPRAASVPRSLRAG